MAVLDSILIAAAAIVLWCLLLYVLQSRGLLERRGLSPSPPPAGPFLMWKTVRGRQLIDRLPRRDRARLFAAGPATNIVLAILFAVIFSSVMATSVQPVHDGVGIVAFPQNTASPAQAAGMQPFTVITSINGHDIHTFTDFTSALARAPLNQSIPVVAYDPSTGASTNYSVILTERRAETGRAVLGILAFDMDTSYYHPLTNPDRFNGIPGAILTYISLPFQGRSPIDEPTVRFYRITGLAAAVPAPLFWLLANTAYWLFWLNAMLGATNALPAVPLDGGYIFKDGVEGLLSRIRKCISTEQRDRIVTNVSRAFAFLILGLVVWQFIGPRI